MTRDELITKIQNLINKVHIQGVPERYYADLFDEVEKLRCPITLTDFLGWEEGVEYRRGGNIFKIEGNHLLDKRANGGWANTNCQTFELIDLRNATKLKKKTYRFAVSGHCELDIKAYNQQEAKSKCKENMKELFDSSLFTNYEFIVEVEE